MLTSRQLKHIRSGGLGQGGELAIDCNKQYNCRKVGNITHLLCNDTIEMVIKIVLLLTNNSFTNSKIGSLNNLHSNLKNMSTCLTAQKYY